MKKTIITLISLILLIVIFLSSTQAFDADGMVDEMLNDNSYEFAYERDEIEEALDSKAQDLQKMLTEDPKAFGYKYLNEVPDKMGKPYKVYRLDNLSSYFWEIPLEDDEGNMSCSIIVDKMGKSWETVYVGPRVNPELLAFYADDEAISEYVKNEFKTSKISKIKRVTNFYFDGIYVKAEGREYVVPITKRPDLLGINNLQVYRLDEVVSKCNIMLKSFNEDFSENH